MMKKATKYGIMIIAAVLVIALAFAGSASAVPITADEWNSMTTSEQINGNSTYEFTGDGIIYPKFNDGSNKFVPTHDVTFDFKDFTGTFAGDPDGNTDNRGSLFGCILNATASIKISIQNLTLSNVNVCTSNGQNVGGIVGRFALKGDSYLNFTNCTLINCSIGGVMSSNYVGGLVGWTWSCAGVYFKNCKVLHCDIVGNGSQVGGVMGYTQSKTIFYDTCNVSNSTVASVGASVAGGLVAGSSTDSQFMFRMCGIENTSVYAGGKGSYIGVGGMAGGITSVRTIAYCIVKNCVVVSGYNYVGGLVGTAGSVDNVEGCSVNGCVISGSSRVGGLVGWATSASGWSDNTVTNCAVNSTATSDWKTNYVCGNNPALENSANCTVTGNNFIRNTSSPSDTITPFQSYGWNTIQYVKANHSGESEVTVTSIGTYGMLGGYGVGSAPKLTYDANEATSGAGWTVTYPMGATVTVADKKSLAKTGMFFNGWNVGSTSGELVKAGSTIIITGDTTLYANWSKTVEVASWSDLVSCIEGYTSSDMGTIVVTQDLVNSTGTEGAYDGINVKGNITIKPGATDVKIDANQKGRLFKVQSGGFLTIKGNDGATLNLTGGNMTGNGGAIYVYKGNLTLSDGASITDCSATSGGGVYNFGTFIMNGGNITGCSAGSLGGGVYVHGTFTMNGGNITDCSAPKGGGVYVNSGTFTMSGGNIKDCCADNNGGGVYVFGMFNVSGSATIIGNTKKDIANNVHLWYVNNLNLIGPFSGSIGIAYPAGAVDTPFGKYVTGNEAYAKNFVSDTPGYFGKVNATGNTLVWALINTTVTPTSGTAEFSGTNTTTLENNDKVSVVLLENVSNVGTSPVTFNASSPVTTPLPAVNGYTKDEEVAIFEITATSTGTSTINLTVTFKDAATAMANKDKVHIFHYTAGTWQPLTSSILAEDGTKITYTAETNGFSPFGIGIYTAVAPSYTPSSSSKQSGSTVILQPGQVAPTQAPTVAPTVAPTAKPTDKPVAPTVAPTANPTAQQTQQSPAPVLGLIAGLGVAGLIYRLRK